MELGVCHMRRTGKNFLFYAIHPTHGLAWSNGVSVFLTKVKVIGTEFEENAHVKLGEFDSVQSLSWSSDIMPGICYMCVVHHNYLTIWRVEGKGISDFSIKQVRKITAAPIPEGCLWNPHRDILTVLTRNQCNFYFRHAENRGSFALPPIDSGCIRCGCWSNEGTLLVVAMNSMIMIYEWPDLDSCISKFEMKLWRIPGIAGVIRCIVPMADRAYALTTELPLDKVCAVDGTDVFDLAELEPSCDGPQDDERAEAEDIVTPLPDSRSSALDKLFSLKLRAKENIRSTAELIVISVKGRDPTKVSSVEIRGFVSPDLLFYQTKSQQLIVASSTQNVVKVYWYSFSDHKLNKVQEIALDKIDRVKGVCSPIRKQHQKDILVLVGQLMSDSHVFLPSGQFAEYRLKLKYLQISPDFNFDNQLPLESKKKNWKGTLFGRKKANQPSSASSSPVRIDALVESEEIEANNGESVLSQMMSDIANRLQSTEIAFETAEENWSFQINGRMQPRNSLSAGSIGLTNSSSESADGKSVVQVTDGTQGEGHCMVERIHEGENGVEEDRRWTQVVKQIEKLEARLKHQEEQISQLVTKIEQMGRVSPKTNGDASPVTPSTFELESVHLVWARPTEGEITKTFMLDQGRLKLKDIKDAFGLTSVEIRIGNNSYVLTENGTGFVPMKFDNGTKFFIKPSQWGCGNLHDI